MDELKPLLFEDIDDIIDETDDFDECYECTGYGDDYYIDEDGELVSACTDCPYNGVREDE